MAAHRRGHVVAHRKETGNRRAAGAGSAIACEFLAQGIALLAIHDIDADRRDRLVATLGGRFGARVAPGGADPRGFDLLDNATPLGMQGNRSKVFPILRARHLPATGKRAK